MWPYGSSSDEKSISSLELAGLLSQFGIPACFLYCHCSVNLCMACVLETHSHTHIYTMNPKQLKEYSRPVRYLLWSISSKPHMHAHISTQLNDIHTHTHTCVHTHTYTHTHTHTHNMHTHTHTLINVHTCMKDGVRTHWQQYSGAA